MKKLVLAMACVLSLGLLASCKNGTQDVNLKNQAATENNQFYGSVTGTFAVQKVSTDGKSYEADSATPTPTLKGSEAWAFSKISWSNGYDKVDSNYVTYTLNAELAYNSGATNATDSKISKTFTFYKIGDKYYTDSYTADPVNGAKKVELTLTGSPEDSEFTISTIGFITANSKTFSTKDIKFTRAN